MKTQYIIILTALILFLLIPLLKINKIEINNYDYLILIGENFYYEINYIAKKFNYNNVSNFTLYFLNYTKSKNINFTFICITNLNLNLPDCQYKGENCCYYFNSLGYISLDYNKLKYCNLSFTLVNNKNWLCFCYKVSYQNNSYSDFFCT